MKKDKSMTILTISEILFVIILLALFVYKCTFVISWESHISLLDMVCKTDSFLEYSYLDSALKFNLLFAICFFIVLLFLRFKKTGKSNKVGFISIVVVLALTVIINTGHLIGYEYASRNEIWEVSSTNDEDFQPIPSEYSKYFPHFNMIDEYTDLDVDYMYNDVPSFLGRYIKTDTWCYDLGVEFSYEEIQTKSSWLLNQFIFTKGAPNYSDDNYEIINLEEVENEKYGCTIYKQSDLYEIWYMREDTCTILKYKGFKEVFEYTENDVLADARELYCSNTWYDKGK